METTAFRGGFDLDPELEARRWEDWTEERRREDELASLSAHLNAATARFLELAWEFREKASCDDFVGWVGYRFGLTRREAGEYLRVAEALQELPAIREAFSQGALSFTKVRALTRVATPASEESLLEVAVRITASQLERALRVYRRIAAKEARETHEFEYVSYYFDDDGSLYLRAHLAAEDGTLVVKALDAARERVRERERRERAAADARPDADDPAVAAARAAMPDPRPFAVEALLEVADAALTAHDHERVERTRVVVHVDAATLTADAEGRSELEAGSLVSPETARRLGCDAEVVAQIEQDGLPVSVGRTRRTIPPALRRMLEARDDQTCCFPGCERRSHLQAHHRRHWAHGGETSLDNLVLLCFHHHRLVHEGGYTVEDDDETGALRFRNSHGLARSTIPPRPPPGSLDELLAEHDRLGLEIGPRTNRKGGFDPFHLDLEVEAVWNCFN